MATPTYEPIETKTLGTATNNVTFSSIPQTYTDLVLVVNGRKDTAVSTDAFFCRLNGDGTSSYSWTEVNGDGSSATTSKITNDSYCRLAVIPGNSAGSTTFGVSIVNFQNYSNTTTYKSILSRGSVADGQVMASVSSWQKTEAITSFTLYTAGLGNWAVGSIFTLYGIANAQIGAPKARGGTITYDDTYFYHTFGLSSTFTPQQSLTADILVVAGGGGGTSAFAGGGGAGGLLGFASQSLTATNYTVTVGGGGAGGLDNTNATPGSVGGDSQFGALTLVKGGGGAQAYESNSPASDANGGSGAGSTYRESSRSNRDPFGTATSGQGNRGGSNNYLTATYGSGGGGGAGTVGANGNTSTDRGGNGGDGSTAYSSWGLATGTGQNVSGTYYYAGGGAGGGGSTSPANTRGGYGGGGNSVSGSSSSTRAESGKTNTGGGGAGGSYGGGSGAGGGAGGSGVVIIRYLKA